MASGICHLSHPLHPVAEHSMFLTVQFWFGSLQIFFPPSVWVSVILEGKLFWALLRCPRIWAAMAPSPLSSHWQRSPHSPVWLHWDVFASYSTRSSVLTLLECLLGKNEVWGLLTSSEFPVSFLHCICKAAKFMQMRPFCSRSVYCGSCPCCPTFCHFWREDLRSNQQNTMTREAF